jgi:hypothetical protein
VASGGVVGIRPGGDYFGNIRDLVNKLVDTYEGSVIIRLSRRAEHERKDETMTTNTRFDLAKLMRAHKVTIRELARRTGFTMKRIREIRAMDRVDYLTSCDLTQAVTGVNVFSLPRYHAMCR